MTLTLRSRILLTLAPLLMLLAVLGGAGVVLLHDLGGRIDLILRKNYESVVAMQRLDEALERIDSSFQFALAGEDAKARKQFDESWPRYENALRDKQNNITLPGEAELVAQLVDLTRKYRRQGEDFYRGRQLRAQREVYRAALGLAPGPALAPAAAGEQALDARRAYFGPGGLLEQFDQVKAVSGEIRKINQQNMKDASQDARQTAAASLVGFAVGLAATVGLAGLWAWHTTSAILRPIHAVTQAATGIRGGNLDQVVAYRAPDELGELAEQFNRMARALRDYRHSHSAQLLRAQRTSQATINSFPDPVLVLDTEGMVEMANPAAQHLFGVVAKRPGAPPAPPWQPPEALRAPLAEALRGQSDYRPADFDHALALGADGGPGFYLPRILGIRDPYGNPLGAAVLLQDVTRFRLLDQVKTDLVATVSHELKTPLASLRLDVHLLLEESLGPLSPKQTELLLDARDSAERLLALVENLLNLARLEERRGQPSRRPESPAALLRAAAEAVRPRARDKGIELAVEAGDELPAIDVDADQLGHALGNLLDNAVAYTDRGGRITLAAAAADGTVTLSIRDTGIGIPPEHLPHVFDRFFRVPGQSRGQGTGLGLALAREIVAAQGGAVACDSTPGAGTTFRLTFPAGPDGPSPAKEAP